jgi:hypothetical protein
MALLSGQGKQKKQRGQEGRKVLFALLALFVFFASSSSTLPGHLAMSLAQVENFPAAFISRRF